MESHVQYADVIWIGITSSKIKISQNMREDQLVICNWFSAEQLIKSWATRNI